MLIKIFAKLRWHVWAEARNRNFILLLLFALLVLYVSNSNFSKLKITKRDISGKLVVNASSRPVEEKISKAGDLNTSSIRDADLIFVGGSDRSGTTLMRVILDVHSRVRCGPETVINRELLDSLRPFLESTDWLKLNNLTAKVVDDTVAHFIYNIILNNGAKAERYCMKDPEAMAHIKVLHRLFPRAKFVYMVRDGRAVVHSRLKLEYKIPDKKALKISLTKWNEFNENVNKQCIALGPATCLRVKYDDLILDHERILRHIVEFLGEKWEPGLLEHEKFIGSEVVVAENAWSANQVKKALYDEALTAWMHDIPYLDESETLRVAPMLETFGYNITFDPAIIEEQKAFVSEGKGVIKVYN